MEIAYVDTSAYLKRFLAEARSDDMEAFVAANNFQLAISSLSVTEFRAVLKRRLLLGRSARCFIKKRTSNCSRNLQMALCSCIRSLPRRSTLPAKSSTGFRPR